SLYPPALTAELAGYVENTWGMLGSVQARGLITTRSLAAAFRPRETGSSMISGLKIVAYEDLVLCANGRDCRDRVDPSLDDIAFVQFTSGSTSAPKGIVVTHRNLSSNIECINGPTGLASSASDRAVSWLPLYHDMGLVGMALGAMYCGRPAVLLT